MSAVALIPGRSGMERSAIRIFTSKFVTSSCDPAFLVVAVLAISRTMPVMGRSGYASTVIRAVSPAFTLTTSFSLTFTTASMLFKSAIRITSVPAN